ncbi:ImmA/IrrE family metallo-endopeptidase [Bifidobacterium samirii]
MVDSKVGTANSRRLDVSEFRAFVLLDKVAPLIFINRNDSYTAMLFSLLHEIGHVLLGSNEVYNDNGFSGENDTERLINQAIVLTVVDDDEQFRNYWGVQRRKTGDATFGSELYSVVDTRSLKLAATAFAISAASSGSVPDTVISIMYVSFGRVANTLAAKSFTLICSPSSAITGCRIASVLTRFGYDLS